MIRRAVLLFSLFLVGCAAGQTIKSGPRIAPVALEEYFKIRRVRGASFSHDDKLVAYMSDQGGRWDVWVQPVGGGKARQITHVQGFVHSYGFSPTRDALLYEADDGGNELPHIYLTSSLGLKPKDLTPHLPPGARTSFVGWAEDGDTFLYLSNKRDLKYLDLYEYHLSTGSSERIWEASGNLALGLASRDHKRFVTFETNSDADTSLFLVERGSEETTPLTPHEGEARYMPASFSWDGGTLYYTSNQDREFTGLYSMALDTRESKPVLVADWDVTRGGFSNGWKYFYTVTNKDGTPEVSINNAVTGNRLVLPTIGGPGALVPMSFSRSDRYVCATLITDTSPVALYVVDLSNDGVSKLTEVLPESLRGEEMVSGKSVRITSFDGRKVPAFIYSPKGKGPFPAVIDVHGGPTSQSRRRFSPMRQYLVSKGYVVCVPNVRGSTGYGKTYTRLDNMDLGGGPLKDVVSCKKWLVKNANVDADKVVLMGGSYGGYMALAGATFTPGEFAAQVDYFGVSDLKTLVESFPPYWASASSYIYKKFGDPTNPDHAEYQHDRSPIHFVDQIETPLLVVQGANDARVRKDQSDRIVAKLEERGVPVHYLVFPDEGHGFSRNENRLAAYEATDRFLDRYIFQDASITVVEN